MATISFNTADGMMCLPIVACLRCLCCVRTKCLCVDVHLCPPIVVHNRLHQMVHEIPITHVYSEPVVLARVTPDEVVHESKCILIADHHTCRRPSPHIHAVYISKAVDSGLLARPSFRSSQFHEEALEQLRLTEHHCHSLHGGIES